MAKIASNGRTKNGSARQSGSMKDTVLNDTAQIERLAYQFFVDRGFQHGYDQEDWARAEAIIKKRSRG